MPQIHRLDRERESLVVGRDQAAAQITNVGA
jgi:hypothetical protein